MKHFVGETLSTAVLDSGCTKNVCGETWLKCYLDTLDEMDLKQVKYQQSSTSFKFGSGERVASMKVVNIPSIISGRKVFIETDVVKCDLPLRLSKDAMKKAEINIDFSTDTVRIFGQKQKLLFTSSGHYCIPIGKHIESNENLASTNERNNLILYGEWTKKSFEEKIKAMEKLHRQFSHAPFKRLKNLLLDTGLNDAEMYNILEEVSNSCKLCKRYKKTPSRPIVGLSLAHVFNETVAMDLKEWTEGSNKTWFLHMIDHATRYSASSIIKSKRKEIIVDEMFKIWVKIFGYPKRILVDNGGEFDNQDFHDFCENLNITIKTTAAESPWSNGMVERHNGIIGESVAKIINDINCTLNVALSWALSAKNSLQNFHGFSPNQLVFGRNPNYPSVLHDKLPALEAKTNSEIIAENLNATHSARKLQRKFEGLYDIT